MKRRPFGTSPKTRASASDFSIATFRANKPSSSPSTTNCLRSTRVQAARDAARKMARPIHLRLEGQPPCARAAQTGSPRAHSGYGWRSGRGHFFREHGFLPSPRTASVRGSGRRIQRCAEAAVIGSARPASLPVHLAVLLWWLLDKSPGQRATTALVSLTQKLLPSAALALRVPTVRRFLISVDGLVREALFGGPVSV